MNNNQKIVVFENVKNLNDIIAQILESNGLKETFEDYLKKIDQKEEPWADIIYESTKNLVSGNITNEEFLSLIKKQLNVNRESAKNILGEIREKLVPTARILSKEDIEGFEEIEKKENRPPVSTSIKPLQPIASPKNFSQIKTDDKSPAINPSQKLAQKIREIPEKIERGEAEKIMPQEIKKRNDVYRESIE